MSVVVAPNFKILPPPGSAYVVPWVAGRTYTVTARARVNVFPPDDEQLFIVGLNSGSGIYWNPVGLPHYALANFAGACLAEDGTLRLIGVFGDDAPVAFTAGDWHEVKLELRWGSGADSHAALYLDGDLVGEGTTTTVTGVPGYNVALYTDATPSGSGVGGWGLGVGQYVDFDYITIDDDLGEAYVANFDDGGESGTTYYHDDWPDDYYFIEGGTALRIGRVPDTKVGLPVSGTRFLDWLNPT